MPDRNSARTRNGADTGSLCRLIVYIHIEDTIICCRGEVGCLRLRGGSIIVGRVLLTSVLRGLLRPVGPGRSGAVCLRAVPICRLASAGRS